MLKRQQLPLFLLLDLVIMYAVTFLLLLLLAGFVYKLGAGETFTGIYLQAVYVAGGFVGGFLIGKKQKQKKYLWGFLMGGLYFVLWFLVSMLLGGAKGGDLMQPVLVAVLCFSSAMVGGMVS